MNFSEETKEKIKQFAKEQSKYYLEEVEMTYLEQLRQKTGQMKSKFLEKFAKLKSRSDISIEAENDMIFALIGFILGGGKEMFLSGGWLETMIGAAVGTMIGIGMGQISNALVLLKSQNK